jgi:integrase
MAHLATALKIEPQQRHSLPRYVQPKKGKLYFRVKQKYWGVLPALDDPGFTVAYIAKCEQAGVLAPQELLASPAPQQPASINYLPGSVGWFIDKYMDPKQSPEWRGFKPKTRYNYSRALKQIKAKLGAGQLADIDTDNLDVYLATQACESTSRADQHKFMISNLWEFAKGVPIFNRRGRPNPTLEAKVHYKVKQPHKPWPAPVIRKFLAAANPYMQCAFHLLLYTGQRRSDVCDMEWADLSGPLKPGVRIPVCQDKTDEKVSLRMHNNLLAFLETWPRHHAKILTSSWKQPYTEDSLSHRIKDVLLEIGADQYTLHGLRKNAGIALAEAGATVPEIMAVLGHRTPKMALYYVQEAA